MWTYLAILFSIFLLIGVFVRRLVLFLKNKDKAPAEKPKSIKDVTEESVPEKSDQKLSRNDKAEASALCQKGLEKIKAGKEDEAIKYFVQALAIDELHIETQQNLAILYMQKQMYGAAAALFKSLSSLTEDPVHYSHLGLALYQQNVFDEAKLAYQKAVDLDPSRPQRFVSLAQVYRSLGELNNAVIALRKAVEMEEKNMDFLLLLSELQIELGNLDEALEIVKRILEIDPKNMDAKLFLKKIVEIKDEKEKGKA